MSDKKIVAISENTWKTEDAVPESGIYRVLHSAHQLPTEVTLARGKRFPRCEACDKPVRFRLIRNVPTSSRFRFDLYQLPAMDERLAG